MALPPALAITAGEPAGIGPELAAVVASENWPARLVLIGDARQLQSPGGAAGRPLQASPWSPDNDAPLQIVDLPLAAEVQPGQLDPRNAPQVVACIERAADGCMAGHFAAMVTGPVNKAVINDAGMSFSGHTEFLAARTNTRRVVMLLAAQNLRVALVTTHLPLNRVSEAITRDRLDETIRILQRDLQQRFGLDQPRICVCGLNPHAGEGGHLGREEITVIEPALEALRRQGFRLTGPTPADTAFTPAVLKQHDVVLAMYHDQGLPVLKHVGFGQAVNVTLGLPIIRTSVDHGTALDIAGHGQADAGSLRAAIDMALEMIRPA